MRAVLRLLEHHDLIDRLRARPELMLGEGEEQAPEPVHRLAADAQRFIARGVHVPSPVAEREHVVRPKVLDVAPGLHTMRDMPLPSFFGGVR